MFSNKVIIVTGAAGNVGRAVARLAAERGAAVTAVDALADPLNAVVAALPEPARHKACAGVDLTDPAACEALIARVVGQFGGLDAVVTTVGGFTMGPLAETDIAVWERMFSLNVKTTWNIYRAAVPALRQRGGGGLVGVGSVAGLKGGGQMAPYAASKAAVLRLTESLADELRADRIRVNAVMPTTIDTPQNRAAMPDADTSRWVTPEEVAEAMLFLASSAASGVTGALLQVG
ncbi:MAG: SDR family NAD(P)-dependent oxidoreductase [Proteobacteria bacterium]|nr:SDR family NAD(P)-dependent oxidoreductase [Pseudomonadota bacterium]